MHWAAFALSILPLRSRAVANSWNEKEKAVSRTTGVMVNNQLTIRLQTKVCFLPPTSNRLPRKEKQLTIDCKMKSKHSLQSIRLLLLCRTEVKGRQHCWSSCFAFSYRLNKSIVVLKRSKEEPYVLIITETVMYNDVIVVTLVTRIEKRRESVTLVVVCRPPENHDNH